MAKKCLYEGVIAPTALYMAEAWGKSSAERRKVNVVEMKYLRSLIRVSRMDRVRNEEVRRRARIERELASRAESIDARSRWRTGTIETEVRLDGWCEGGRRQQMNDCGGCASMHERV